MSGCREPASFVLGTAYRKQCNVLFTVSCSYRVEESGDTCFLNATVQMLRIVPVIRDPLQTQTHQHNSKDNSNVLISYFTVFSLMQKDNNI